MNMDKAFTELQIRESKMAALCLDLIAENARLKLNQLNKGERINEGKTKGQNAPGQIEIRSKIKKI